MKKINILTPEALAMLGIFCGLAAKTLAPYIRKTVIENKPLKWQHRFTGIFILCGISSIMLFPSFSPPINGLKVYVAAFMFGIAANWSATEVYQWGKSYLEMRKEKEADEDEN